jgi:hypothetical protein
MDSRPSFAYVVIHYNTLTSCATKLMIVAQINPMGGSVP